jgi:regulator of extracellular matrix RemA (YlzA/DUF370 family)
LSQAREKKKYIDLTAGRGVKSLLLMIEGQVVGCSMKPATMLRRLNASDIDGEEFDACL